MDFIIFLHVFTITNKLLLFLLFFSKRNNSLANKMLALLILLPAFPMVSNYIFYTEDISHFPPSLFLTQAILSFFGPIYFFYCKEMMGISFKRNRKNLLHLLPCIFVILLWINYAISSEIDQQKFMASFLSGDETTLVMVIASAGPTIIVLIYILVAAQWVYKRIKVSKDVFTNLETLKINYIREFIWVMLIELIMLTTAYTFTPVFYVDLVWVPVLGNLMYFYIIYKSYNYGMLFSEKDYKEYKDLYAPLNLYIEETESKKYLKSPLSSAQIDEYAELLTMGFENQDWHLDPELNLNTLSVNSDIPTHYISQIINQKFEKNFFDYVNYYRVEAFKTKLNDPSVEHIKFEELAYMCGFNSKATFQRAFKKHTGMTPSEYRDTEISFSRTGN